MTRQSNKTELGYIFLIILLVGLILVDNYFDVKLEQQNADLKEQCQTSGLERQVDWTEQSIYAPNNEEGFSQIEIRQYINGTKLMRDSTSEE